MKMNCTDIDSHIDGFLDRALSKLETRAFEQHVSGCAECSSRVDAEKMLRSKLHSLPVPPPSPDFRNRVLARVRHEYANESQNHYGMTFAAGFASIAVFALALWFMAGIQPADPVTDNLQVIPVAINQSQSVRLIFHADSEIRQAELSIHLPDNVRLVGYPGRDRLTWQTSLHKGQNILTLPVMTSTEGRGELHTRLTYNNRVKTHHFIVDAKDTNSSGETHRF